MSICIDELVNFLTNVCCIHTTVASCGCREIVGYSNLANPIRKTMTWVKDPGKLHAADARSLDAMLVISNGYIASLPSSSTLIICKNHKAAFFSAVKHFFVQKRVRVISSHAEIQTEKIGHDVSIGHFSYIGPDVEIGDDVIIGNNVSIECPCKVGSHSRIGSGTVIGNDGYGYYKDDNGIQHRVPHTGGVIIGEHVEIDANVCIDRGTIGDTIIGDYVKIDNFVQIAHNDNIEAHSMVVSHAVIAGSVKIEERAYIAPGAIVLNQKKVGAGSLVGAGSVVVGNVKSGKVVAGSPAAVLWDNK